MRALILLSALLLPAPGLAEDPDTIRLRVGEKRPMPATRPICDDPGVAVITPGEGLTAVGPGRTTCSLSDPLRPGIRRVFTVVVTVDPPAPDRTEEKR